MPGSPGAVAGLGDALAGYADLLADAAHALGRVEVSWEGAAAGGFRDEFGLQPGRFSAAARSFDSACAALGRYAATLLSAQLAAGRARDLFAEGMRAAAAAAAAAAAGGGGALAVDAGPLDLLTSPAGREQRLAAVELLERVRADVDRSGTEAADTLRDAMAGAPEPVPAWQHAMNFLVAPPWDLNQERRDWAAGGGVGILDTVV
ncbi:MAG: putative T7SS-secreted protein, partial [Actinomycetales bacterium]